MSEKRPVTISNGNGEQIIVNMTDDVGRENATLFINGQLYHFERITPSDLISNYRVDLDPDYWPQTDANGFCYILAPFSE